MGVVVENRVWEPSPWIYLFMFLGCFFSITLCSRHSKSLCPFDRSSSSFLRFHRKFLFLFSLASLMEGLWSIFGEFELLHYGLTKRQIVSSLCIGYGVSLFFGPLLGMLSDLIGHKKVCLVFCILHLVVGLWKKIVLRPGPGVWLTTVCLSLAMSIFTFSFEGWVVVENDKEGHRQDALSDTFWLMTLVESAALIGSQVLANWLVGNNLENGISSTSTATIILAIIGIICLSREWKEAPQTASSKDYSVSYALIFSDKRMWLLGLAHASLQFSVAVFWILWAPTLVADGREVNLGLIYPCLMGARMLGSTIFPWLLSVPLPVRMEDCLVYAFIIVGFALSTVAYDYQEVGFLVALFCLFHMAVGLITPSLARLRTMHVPNELRGGMIGLSLTPANAAVLFFLLKRGGYQNIENSTMMAFAVLGLFLAAGCMQLLKQWGKQPYQNWHKL
ncbi:hypothetical protein K2173_002523 [Erythroxylum novogranatense]|uniref:Molybdate-anion transporter-like n=1 Tax=Erythroxylum novogranatense TaxID=1862640 RepID=A0AAV8TTT7_9ROSI|nr:hypothetical protein K2173_002523 [Erythroxylum novogranatense]